MPDPRGPLARATQPRFQREIAPGASENLRRPAARTLGTLLSHNITCRVHAALLATWMITAALPPHAARAQPATDPLAQTAAAPADLPSAADCLNAFRAVEAWVRVWDATDQPAPGSAAAPANTAGVCVTLRLAGAAGRTLSRSVVWIDDESRATALLRATRAALAEAEPKLKLRNDATRDAARLDIARRILVDVQFAGAPVPAAAQTIEALSASLNPGRDGVLVRVRADAAASAPAPDAVAAVFPASMLSMGLTPARAVGVALGELKLPPVPLAELREKSGVEVYRFESRHAAQIRPGAAPELLYRAGALIPMQAVDSRGLRDFAAAIADHIAGHLWRGPGSYGLRGNYNPLTDAYQPAVAPPREQAVAAFALLRFADTPGVDNESVGRAREAALLILDRLTDRAEGEEDPLAPTAAAAWLIASAEARWCGTPAPGSPPGPDHRAAFREAALKSVRSVVKAETTPLGERVTWLAPPTAEGKPAQAAAIPQPAERALLTLALARTAGEDPQARRLAAACVRDLFRATEPGALVALMPWLAFAETALLQAPDAPLPSAEALRQLRALCWSRQLTQAQAGENPDLAGGLLFTAPPDAARPTADPAHWPTWQSLRPLALMGSMLADTRLTPDAELRDEVLRLLASLRFVRQLAADETVSHMFRDPSRARGGVRAAVWDQTILLDASSMALLTISEALRGAEARSP